MQRQVTIRQKYEHRKVAAVLSISDHLHGSEAKRVQYFCYFRTERVLVIVFFTLAIIKIYRQQSRLNIHSFQAPCAIFLFLEIHYR